MLAIELFLLSGRFHATPWGRHVNEGVPEWPPSPYRLVRALYDVWKRKRHDWPEVRVERLLAALASPPMLHLPPANPSHTRSFLSQNSTDAMKRQLIFDGFVAVDPAAPLLMGWPDTTLDAPGAADLDELLSLLNYLGRSESWVSARLCDNAGAIPWNCRPLEDDVESGDTEIVQVACAMSPAAYGTNSNPMPAKKATRRRTSATGNAPLQQPWIDALTWSTTELLASKRSEPPALQFVAYRRSSRCFEVMPRQRARRNRPEVYGVLYALESKVPPRIFTAVSFAERIRRKLMGLHKAIVGDPSRVSRKFSGKNAAGRPLDGHRHVFILPQDRNQDGRIDHVLVVCKEPLDANEQLALDRLETIWQSDGKPDVRFIPIRSGTREQLLSPALRFVSTTPLVLSRHYRRGRGEFGQWLKTEICRELSHHGLPEPAHVRFLPKGTGQGGRNHRWLEFQRSRKGEPVRPGYGLELEFTEPVAGPFALGYGCHFGLGQFMPLDPAAKSG